MSNPELYQSARFKKGFEKLGPGLTKQVFGAIHDVVRLYRENKNTFVRRFDTLAHLNKVRIMEIKIASGSRMLVFHKDDRLTLLDVGDHEIVPRYQNKFLMADLKGCTRVGRCFFPEDDFAGFISQTPSDRSEAFGNELDPEWVYYLTDTQKGIVRPVVSSVPRADPNNPRFRMIVGGPGTGKTAILLKILLDVRGQKRARPLIVLSDQVGNYIEKALGIDLCGCRVTHESLAARNYRFDTLDTDYNVLLVDDPRTTEEINAIFDAAYGICRVAVVAFDPYQLKSDITDRECDSIVETYSAKSHVLKECYRQKERVGRETLKVIEQVASSSPFLHGPNIEHFHKSRQYISDVSNNISFPNPRGYWREYIDADRGDVIEEVRRVRKKRLWKHSPPILLVIDSKTEATRWRWRTLLGDLEYTAVTIYPRDYSELEKIQGLEFQHTFFFVASHLYEELRNGFVGTGQPEYRRRRLLRIPWSRSKDSTVAFVMSTD